MNEVKPEVHLIASTAVNLSNMQFDELGSTDWDPDTTSDAELLIEFGGRLCYKSFSVGSNPNVSRVRDDSEDYIGNILKHKHGSVLEHASVSFLFMNVSRILTHELVRHRAGCAFSQESMRYVRFKEVPIWLPSSLDISYLSGVPYEAARGAGARSALGMSSTEWATTVRDGFIRGLKDICERYEQTQKWLNDMMALDDMINFHVKKTYTSLLRRLCPSGVATNILMTANHRAWRHIVEMRANKEHVEEELYLVALRLGDLLKANFPLLYQDMDYGPNGWVFNNSKV